MSHRKTIDSDSIISYLNNSELFIEGECTEHLLIKDYPEYYVVVGDEYLIFGRSIPNIKFLKVRHEHLYDGILETKVLNCLREIEDIYYFSCALYNRMLCLSEYDTPLISLKRYKGGQYRLYSDTDFVNEFLNSDCKCYTKCFLSLTGDNYSSATLHWNIDCEYKDNNLPNRETLRRVYIKSRTENIDIEVIPDQDNPDDGIIRLMDETIHFSNKDRSYYDFLREKQDLLNIHSARTKLLKELLILRR